MANNYKSILWATTSRGTYLGGKLLFIFCLFCFQFSAFSQSPETTVPSYTWQSSVDVATVTVSELNTEDIIISIATDVQGNVYSLSFGNGVSKRDANGALINSQFIPANQLDNPLDIAIDKEGYIYIADFLSSGDTFEDNGKIRVFNTAGQALPNRTILTSFYRPLGLDVNSEKVYVAEYNDAKQGPEQNQELSRIRVYDKFTGAILDVSDQVEIPLRIAVDSKETIYVSQAGNNSPAVLYFDADLNYQGKLQNITSPGSVVVDEFDFIHINEYANRVNFSEFINFNNLGPTDILRISGDIKKGIDNEEFVIKIYDPQRNYQKPIVDKIDFPVDLIVNSCDKMYVNNSDIIGFPLFGTFIPTEINFDLEIYKRSPSMDKAEPPVITCPSDITVDSNPGENYAIVNYNPATATDNCNASVARTGGLASGSQFPIGPSIVEFTATDGAGNSAICSFTITVNAVTSTDTEKPVISCPAPISKNVDPGECGAAVTFANATATDNLGSVTVSLISDLSSGSEFPIGTSTVTFEAKDAAGNTSECSFTITITDNEDPTISCPATISETVAFGETGKTINYSAPTFDDNCSGSTILQTDGLPSGSEFQLGTTINTFVVSDAKGNTATCSFDVTITESSDTEKPVINCPDPISKTADPGECGAVVTFANATATDNSGETPTITRVDNTGLNSGDLFPVGPTTISFRATDASGNFIECSFTITVTDDEKPTISCLADISETVAIGETGKTINYSAPVFDDNCSGSTINQTAGLASGSRFPLGTTTNTFEVTDGSGNTETCSFDVTITESSDTEKPVINCPVSISQNTDPGQCGAVVTFANATATDNSGSVSVSLISSLSSGSEFPIGTSTVTFQAKDAAGNTAECSFTITITDNEDPTISCPSNISETVGVGETGKIINYTAPVFDDNCSGSTINQTAGLASGSEFPLGTTTNTFVVTDGSGNISTCAFDVVLTEENPSNTAPISRDDIHSTLQDVTLTVPASSGVLSNDSDEEGDALTAVLITDVSSGTLTLNPDGSFIYVPNSGFSGNDFFTYTANDGSLNSVASTARIEVVAVSGNTVTCKDSVTLELDENGTGSLNAEDLFTTRPADLEFSISQEIFTCEDLGENTITLSYSNSDVQGSCEVIIIVKDVSAPIIRVKDISVPLNQFGSANITPEMVDKGSSDNCEDLSFSLSKLNFGCKELGENTVTFTATDASGNSTSMTATVTITGSCEIQPTPEVEYIFIYPNPTTGPFQFATPDGVTIQRVEVFDNRGRMIMYKEYSAAELQYAMDLSGVQDAVYILKLFTSDGTSIVRVIIN